MKVKMILPALADPKSPRYRPVKFTLFPPLGLAALAAYLGEDDEVTLQDEHVEAIDLQDSPEVVVIQVYITNAYRAYALADHYRRQGAHVCLGGLHVTAVPQEAARHADTIFLGPGEDTWPAFLADFRAGQPGRIYQSRQRTLCGQPPIRRDLIKRQRYLVPNSLVVSRGCPHACDFCYKENFYRGGASYYTQPVEAALMEIERLPGRHLFFLDDNILGHRAFASALFDGMRGMGRLWQGAGTVQAVLEPGLLEKAVASGMRELFVGFETLNPQNLREQHKLHNLDKDYTTAIRRLHDQGVMIHGSFVFGMDDDDESVFDRTVEWAVGQGIEAATFHILTPYPGTALYDRMRAAGRITSENWDHYDTRHVVYQPAKLAPEVLEAGYWRAYRDFYSWGKILQSAAVNTGWRERLRQVAYAGVWKKGEPCWDALVRLKRFADVSGMMERVLACTAGGRRTAPVAPAEAKPSLVDLQA